MASIDRKLNFSAAAAAAAEVAFEGHAWRADFPRRGEARRRGQFTAGGVLRPSHGMATASMALSSASVCHPTQLISQHARGVVQTRAAV